MSEQGHTRGPEQPQINNGTPPAPICAGRFSSFIPLAKQLRKGQWFVMPAAGVAERNAARTRTYAWRKRADLKHLAYYSTKAGFVVLFPKAGGAIAKASPGGKA